MKAGGKKFWKPSIVEEVPSAETVATPVVESKKPVVETPPDWLKPKIYKSSNLI